MIVTEAAKTPRKNMEYLNIGIGDIGVYLPSPCMNLDLLVNARKSEDEKWKEILPKAIEKTGQSSFRFPEPWEDTCSLAANAAASPLDRLGPKNCEKIRLIAVGTETSVDHSKPVASYVQGMLRRSGYALGTSMTTFETKHACAGQTTALLSAASIIGCSADDDERALVIGSDIARYDTPSTAEITQGAGAVALIVEKNPRLLELDLRTQGYYASDVDDFFRPLESVTARVKGRYSMECYQEAMGAAIQDYAQRKKTDITGVFEETDYVALHVPFATMPVTAITGFLNDQCGWDSKTVDGFLKRTGFIDALEMSRTFGNLYTGSLYAYIAALLNQEFNKHGNEIIGKKILVASYGSGNTMMVYSVTIASGAPDIIASWDLQRLLKDSRPADFTEYVQWLKRPSETATWNTLLAKQTPQNGRFFLKGFKESGLRIYDKA